MTEASIGFLRLRQSEIGAKFSDDYDLLLSVLGWETRALQTIPLFAQCSGRILGFRFESEARDILLKKSHIQRLFLQELSPRAEIVHLRESHRFVENCALFDECLWGQFQKSGRPMRVLVDMSCLPKRYLLYILGSGLRNELVNSFDFVYSEGRYDINSVASTKATSSFGLISNGEWSSLQIPYMEGRSYSPKTRDLFISLGAEISAAMPIVDRFEPDKLVLFPVANNAALMENSVLASENNALRKLEELPNARSEPFAINDVVGLAERVCSLVASPTTCLSIGSKPHALAFGVASLANDSVEVVCRVPNSYSGIEVAPTGRLFRFVIEDRFDPMTYLPRS